MLKSEIPDTCKGSIRETVDFWHPCSLHLHHGRLGLRGKNPKTGLFRVVEKYLLSKWNFSGKFLGLPARGPAPRAVTPGSLQLWHPGPTFPRGDSHSKLDLFPRDLFYSIRLCYLRLASQIIRFLFSSNFLARILFVFRGLLPVAAQEPGIESWAPTLFLRSLTSVL